MCGRAEAPASLWWLDPPVDPPTLQVPVALNTERKPEFRLGPNGTLKLTDLRQQIKDLYKGFTAS